MVRRVQLVLLAQKDARVLQEVILDQEVSLDPPARLLQSDTRDRKDQKDP